MSDLARLRDYWEASYPLSVLTGVGTPKGAGVEPGGGYDPGAATIDEVKAYIDGHPDELPAVRVAESAGKNRVTLIAWLDEYGTEPDAEPPVEESE